jgi:hypothetical protein
MGIVNRFWSRETAPPSLDLSLAERLKQLSGRPHPERPAKETDGSAESANAAEAQNAKVTEAAEAAAVAAGDAQPDGQKTSAPAEASSTDRGSKAGAKAVQPESRSEIPANEVVPVTADELVAEESIMESENGPRKDFAGAPAMPQGRVNTESDTGRKFFRAPRWGSKPQNMGNADQAKGNGHVQEPAKEFRQESAPVAPASLSHESILPLVEQFKTPVDQAEARGESTVASVRQALAELQTAKQEFETEIRDRLDVAIAEYERRLTSEALVNEAAGQFEQRTKQATDKIFREVKDQAWVMLNAVGSELRAFREQFGKDIQDRAGLLDDATQQAMQVKEKLEETIPVARDILKSLPLAGEEAAARVQAASATIAEFLHSSRESLSQQMENHKNAFKALLQECRQEEMRLKEEIEKFRVETGSACDVLGRLADESLDRLNAGTQEAQARIRTDVENLAGEIEKRLLSADLVDKATAQIETAVQAVVDPALERIRQAGNEADTVAGNLTRAGQEVTGKLGAARQEIESKLDSLMSEQQSALESSMNGFHRKAAEELGSVVERVVAQSSQQLDERLHSLFEDLLASTSDHINGVTRSTLSTLHDGLKDIFVPEHEEAVANSGEGSDEE